jgi:hypothetical protein
MTSEERDVVTKLWGDSRFHLTGSRYWNSIDPVMIPLEDGTDVDFVTEFYPDTVQYLIELGFRPKDYGETSEPEDSPFMPAGKRSEAEYGDGTTYTVMYYGCIQAIMKKDVEIYLAVQNSVGVEFYCNYLWKKNTPTDCIQMMLAHLYEVETIKRNLHLTDRGDFPS